MTFPSQTLCFQECKEVNMFTSGPLKWASWYKVHGNIVSLREFSWNKFAWRLPRWCLSNSISLIIAFNIQSNPCELYKPQGSYAPWRRWERALWTHLSKDLMSISTQGIFMSCVHRAQLSTGKHQNMGKKKKKNQTMKTEYRWGKT